MSQPLQAIFALVLLGAFALTQSPRAGADDLSALEAAAFRAAADRVAEPGLYGVYTCRRRTLPKHANRSLRRSCRILINFDSCCDLGTKEIIMNSFLV